MIGNLIAGGGALMAVFATAIRYLIPLWPAEGVDPGAVDFHVGILQYSGVLLAVAGAFLVARKAASRSRQVRIVVLSGAVIVLTSVSVFRGNTDLTPVEPATRALPSGKYHFSTDWVSENTENWGRLLAQLKGKPNIHALEVGSFEGRSALWFLENVLTDPNSSITCVDIWIGPYENTFDENIKAYGYPGKVIKIKNRSDVAMRTLKPRSYDFIYIDGSHIAKDVLVDAVLAWDLLKPGGIMIFDDYNWKGPRSWLVENDTPKIAIDAFVDVFGPYFELLQKDYQLAIKKKDPGKVDIETFKSLHSFILRIQHWFG